MQVSNQNIKSHLFRELKNEKAFWSYSSPLESQMSDEDLIEKVIIHLEKNDIMLLFKMFPKSFIKKVWRERLVPQEPHYHTLNRYMAFIYFDIKNPDKYFKRYTLR